MCEHQSGISCNNQVRLQGILKFVFLIIFNNFFCIIYAKMHEKLTFFPSKNIFCPLLWESSFQKVPYSSRNLLYKKSVSSKKSLIVRESLIHRVPYCERGLYVQENRWPQQKLLIVLVASLRKTCIVPKKCVSVTKQSTSTNGTTKVKTTGSSFFPKLRYFAL